MTSTHDSWQAAQVGAPSAGASFTGLPEFPKPDPVVLEGDAAVERARETWGRRCPATARFDTSGRGTFGIQCKYMPGHEGDHAGPKPFGLLGDMFWPKDAEPVAAPPCYGA